MKKIIITPPAPPKKPAQNIRLQRITSGRNTLPPPSTPQEVEKQLLRRNYDDRCRLGITLLLAATMQTAGVCMIIRMFKPSWGMAIFLLITTGVVFTPLILNNVWLRKTYKKLSAT